MLSNSDDSRCRRCGWGNIRAASKKRGIQRWPSLPNGACKETGPQGPTRSTQRASRI
jgi:hypothetical protein